jgi:3-hydroxyisobutyrate dehydrogenase-like beta-hydroxyacid dehydrogenase
MDKFVLGFIGFGEASHAIAQGLFETSKPSVVAFDVMADVGTTIKNRANECQVRLLPSLASLIGASDVILCATSAKYALSIAQDAALFLKEGKIYADLNSASPKVKKEIAAIVDPTGALFADSAVMEIVPPYTHRVPIAVSGSGARLFTEMLQSIGMNATYINDQAGSSSAMKMFRSVFMKGFTSLMLETFLAAQKMGVCDQVLESVSTTLQQNSVEKMANLLINRTAVGYERRISEMEDVVSTLEDLHIDPFASLATIERLSWMGSIHLKEHLNGVVPKDFHEVLDLALKLSE